ncbi:MAG: hypothetical protein WKF35_00170 [Ferruginibacter sp.]
MRKMLLQIGLLFILIAPFSSTSQTTGKTSNERFKKISAGPQYKRSIFYQGLWGRNYRKEWITPVTLPVIYLDTLRGGLISYKLGGSNQSKSLQLKTLGDKEYALRSVDKSLEKVIPDIFQGTFVSDLVNDQISMSNPYGALGVPLMADAIGMNHTNPEYFYLPEQKALDTLNKKYAGKVYLLEQRPKGDWSDADNLGNFKKFEDLEDMLPHILKDYNYMIDQPAFARARLFDILIGDFDRHGDQWKWGVKKEGDKKTLIPVPTDRDQAFSTHNGILLNLVIRVAGLKFLQEFDDKVDNVKAMAQINRLLDRLVTNKMTLTQWQAIATDMQGLLTDRVIEASIKQMPPEIFAIRGNQIISKLKSRRAHLVEYATAYYGLLAEESEVVGTQGDEYFEINNLDGNKTEIKLFHLDKKREKEETSFYSRIFKENETDEIRLYGLAGNDVYKVNGKLNKEIKLRIIGGSDRDSIIDESSSNRNTQIHVYDNADNYFKKTSNTRLHLSEDSAIHVYEYNSFLADKKGLIPHLGFNDADRIFLGAKYRVLNHRWRKRPFAYLQSLDAVYSITQKGFSTTYNGLFPKLFGQWDLAAQANYDEIRWLNFYGLGNETPNITDNRDFYRMRSEEVSATAGVGRIWRNNNMRISGFYQRVKIINDTARFVSKVTSAITPGTFTPDNFAGAQISYDFADVKDSVLPQKGITFSLQVKHTQNLEVSDRSYQLYAGNIQFFIPLIPKISLAIKTGGSTITGSPLFYQYPSLGESFNLRGFRRERFSGKSTFYNNAELRFISKFRSYLFNGKAGLMAFVDNGRVWLPGEKSDKFHTTYGGGILLAPFNIVSAAITYGISKEEKMLQFRLGVLF